MPEHNYHIRRNNGYQLTNTETLDAFWFSALGLHPVDVVYSGTCHFLGALFARGHLEQAVLD